MVVSTRDGGAKTTAVLEMVADGAVGAAAAVIVAATAAPTGSLGGGGLAFCATLRRIGAKARLADHPLTEHGRTKV